MKPQASANITAALEGRRPAGWPRHRYRSQGRCAREHSQQSPPRGTQPLIQQAAYTVVFHNLAEQTFPAPALATPGTFQFQGGTCMSLCHYGHYTMAHRPCEPTPYTQDSTADIQPLHQTNLFARTWVFGARTGQAGPPPRAQAEGVGDPAATKPEQETNQANRTRPANPTATESPKTRHSCSGLPLEFNWWIAQSSSTLKRRKHQLRC